MVRLQMEPDFVVNYPLSTIESCLGRSEDEQKKAPAVAAHDGRGHIIYLLFFSEYSVILS